MGKTVKRKFIILIALTCVSFLNSCMNIAKPSHFKTRSSDIDFENVISSKSIDQDRKWNSKTNFEYYLQIRADNQYKIVLDITTSLKDNGYSNIHADTVNNFICAKKGRTLNEWNSLTGIYYRIQPTFTDIYIKTEITQDITGGWRDNRAESIGREICARIKTCSTKYVVWTQKK